MTETDATAISSPDKKKGGLGEIIVPVAALLVGAAAGAAGMYFVPGAPGSSDSATMPRPAKPVQYYDINNSFTANLKDSSRLVQIKVAVSTTYGAPVVDALEKHRLPMIAAVLAVLSDCTEKDVESTEGREKLAGRIRSAINSVLQSNEGLTGVDNVYLTSLILQ